MPIPVNNFRLVSVLNEAPPKLVEYDTFNDYQIYQSQYNFDIYVIYDHDFNVYRSLEFMGQNILELEKNLKIYIEQYYIDLPDVSKATTTM